MVLLSSHTGLAELLGSPELLTQMWPAAAVDVMALVHLLVVSASLAQVLTLRLVVLMTPAAGSPPAVLALAMGSVVMTALALGIDRRCVTDPHSNPRAVTGLEVLDIAVGGLSVIRVAG